MLYSKSMKLNNLTNDPKTTAVQELPHNTINFQNKARRFFFVFCYISLSKISKFGDWIKNKNKN